jgi:predicted MPP superfamily phosphohydrolase
MKKHSKAAKMVCGIFLILIAALFCISYFDVKYPKVNYVDVVSDKLSTQSSFKILQVSDCHDSRLNDFVLDSAGRLEPDIIVITGDLISAETNSFENTYRLVEELVKVNPSIYFVSGNHEWVNKSRNYFLQGLAVRGVKILNNKNKSINIDGNTINLCGVDDFYTSHGDLDKASEGIEKDSFTVLLSHSPNVIEKLDNDDIDIILSGHTHGGQVRLPLIGAIAAPGQGLFPKYSKGMYNVQERTLLYIDSGLGTSIIPVRLFNRSQLSLITVRGK